jgi:hypothetical protein
LLSLFAFDLFRFGDIFGGQLTQLVLGLRVAYSGSMPPTFVGLRSQMSGLLGHGPALVKAIL